MTARPADRSPPTPSKNRSGTSTGSPATPAYARVWQQLRQDILAGVFPWGGRLKIAELIRRYGVSQMPIREALEKLQGEGLVTSQPNCGACVRKIDEKFLADIYDLRGAISEMLIRRAIARVTEPELRALEIILDTHEQAERRGELAASLEYNKQFHRVIGRLADNPDATEILERYWDLIDASRRQFGFSAGFMATVITGHRELFEAIQGRDVETAVRIARENCERSKLDMIAQMQSRRQSAEAPRKDRHEPRHH